MLRNEREAYGQISRDVERRSLDPVEPARLGAFRALVLVLAALVVGLSGWSIWAGWWR